MARLIKALPRAWRWQRLLDAGVYSSVTDLSEAEAISKSYVHRILRLALLAPEIVGLIWCGTLFEAASRSPECDSKLGVRRSATKLLIHLDD